MAADRNSWPLLPFLEASQESMLIWNLSESPALEKEVASQPLVVNWLTPQSVVNWLTPQKKAVVNW